MGNLTITCLLLLALVGVTARCNLLRAAPAASTEKPDIVFFLADDLGYMDIGANNPKTFYQTPRIDSLAAKGMRFTSGYAACPVCSPTRASIMTGKYPVRTGVTDYIGGHRAGKLLPAPNQDHLALEEVTLAEALRAAGYTNFFAGKWHLGGKGSLPRQVSSIRSAVALTTVPRTIPIRICLPTKARTEDRELRGPTASPETVRFPVLGSGFSVPCAVHRVHDPQNEQPRRRPLVAQVRPRVLAVGRHHDEAADPAHDVLKSRPESVLSGRILEEID